MSQSSKRARILQEAKRLASEFDAAAALIAKALTSLTPVNFSEGGAQKINATVKAAIRRLSWLSKKWTERAIPEIYQGERLDTKQLLITAGEGPRGRRRYWDERHRETIGRLKDQTFQDLLRAVGTIETTAGRYITLVRQSSQSVLQLQAFGRTTEEALDAIQRLAFKEGLARKKVSDKIMDVLRKHASEGNFIKIGARNYNLAHYAELCASVRMREAATEATKNAAGEFEHDLVEIPFKAGSCEDCQAIEGEIYSLSGRDPDFPALEPDETPPLHPFCEHYIRVVSSRQERAARGG